MKKLVEASKCPNCTGRLEKSEDGLKMICPYCMSEFELIDDEVDKNEVKPEKEDKANDTDKTVKEVDSKKAEDNKNGKKTNSEEGFNKPEWLDVRVEFKKLCKGRDSKDAMKTFAYCINELGTSEAIIKYIKRELSDESGIYYEKHKEEKLKQFLASKGMKGATDASDNVIFYVNTGVFSCGKHGFIVTDKKIVFDGRKPHIIEYSDLRKIACDMDADFASIRLNSSYDTSLAVIEGGSDKPIGAFAALVCALAFENEPDRDKIIICKFGDDDED